MVSTRGHRYKFSEGERVLCYEPDLTKAKVLYDSKVLEVIEAKDKRGRRSVEYLIHFQGWNSSWDRCVSEDFVLKDTEENRLLQKTLAEKSQLQLGAYLYRRRGGSTSAAAGSSTGNTGTGGRRNRTAFEDEGSSSSSRHPEDEGTRSDSSGTNSSGHISADPRAGEMPSPACAPIALGPGLRDRLTMDYHLVTKRGRLAWLPARPNVLEVLQACVRHHIARAATATPRPRRPRTGPAQPDLQHHLRRLNLMREVADGLRTYFDFILKDQLLYEQEEAQYQDNITKKIMRDPRAPLRTEDSNDGKVAPEEYAHLPPSPAEEGPDTPARRLRSHKSPTTTPQPMEVTEEPSTKDIPGPSSVETPPASIDGSNYPELNGTTAEVFRRALDWRIVPPDHPPYPTAIYGATHLARLFVKLPDYLSLIVMPEAKLKLIIEYVEIFVQFLEEHEEWFGESFYYDTNPSTS